MAVRSLGGANRNPGGRYAGLLLLLSLALLLAACGRSPYLPKLAPDDVVLAFGDSLTSGVGAGNGEAYPEQLARFIGRRVVNAGVPGETTAEGHMRIESQLKQHRPRLLLLCLGGNDMLRRQDPGQTAENLRAMIRLAKADGVAVALIGVPQPSLFSGPPAFYEEIAEEFGLPYEGKVFDEVLRSPRLKADAIHANAEGYRRVAERLAELLREAGAV